MIRSGDQLQHINEKLAALTACVHLNNGQGRIDINKDAEDFYCGLLNILLDSNLENLNYTKRDYPAIDLGDRDRKLAVQVTSTNSRDKIRETLKTFFENNQDRHFSCLIILIIGQKERYKKPFKTERGFQFSADRDIWDINRLGGEIARLSEEKRAALEEYLDEKLIDYTPGGSGEKKLNLPLPTTLGVDGFVGRTEELETLQKALEEHVKPIVISGLGGMGKTELAIRFGQLQKERRVHYVRFSESFRQTVSGPMALGVENLVRTGSDGKARPEEEIYREVMELLKSFGPNELLIIDNVDGEVGNLGDLKDDAFDALCALRCSLVLTTRFEAPGAVKVERMDNKILYRIFRKHALALPEEQMDDLIEAVDGHTMTIDLIARTLKSGWRPVTAEMMLEALKNSTLAMEKYKKIPTDYNRAKEQVQIYGHLCMVFDMAGIPEDARTALRCATLLPEGGMEAELFGMSLPEAVQDTLDPLMDRGWLRLTDSRMVDIHPVIRLVCREELKPTDKNCGEFLRAVWGQYDQEHFDNKKFSKMAELFTAASRWLKDSGGDWAACAGEIWYGVGAYAKAYHYAQCQLDIRKEFLLEDQLELADAYYQMGKACDAVGKYRSALEYLFKAMELRKKKLPPEHLDLAKIYRDIGAVLVTQEQFQDALKYSKKALEIYEKILPMDDLELARAYCGLGGIYGCMKNIRGAMEYQLKALFIRERKLKDHPDLCKSYGNVAMLWLCMGDCQKALDNIQKCLDIQEKILPEDHRDLATTYNNLALIYGHQNRYDMQLHYNLKSMEVYEKTLPEDHQDLATAYNNVSTCYCEQKSYPKALEYQQKALDICEKVLPDNHSHLAQSYLNMGMIYVYMAKDEKAAVYFEKALKVYEVAEAPSYSEICTVRRELKRIGEKNKKPEWMSQIK